MLTFFLLMFVNRKIIVYKESLYITGVIVQINKTMYMYLYF